MVIDTSALIAILLAEPEAERLARAIAAAESRRLPAPLLVECAAVLFSRVGPPGEIALDALLRDLEVEVVPMSAEAAESARAAYRRFGKGVGTPGVLNYGDCLAYGVAAALREPLLFKGSDFAATDVAAASY